MFTTSINNNEQFGTFEAALQESIEWAQHLDAQWENNGFESREQMLRAFVEISDDNGYPTRLTYSDLLIRGAQSASGRATAEKLGPEGKTKRAKAGAAARWGECHLQTRTAHGWADVESPAPDVTLDSCRESLEWIRQERLRESTWAAEYRIVRIDSDGNLIAVVEYCDLTA